MSSIRLDSLNPQQRQAVEHFENNLLVVAGPGTGKTHTLVYRVSHHLSSLKSNQKSLVITFTQKSAQELKERFEKFIPDQCSKICVGTFHQVSMDLLREYSVSKFNDFQLISTVDQDLILKKIWPGDSSKIRKTKLNDLLKEKNTQYLNDEISDFSDDLKIYQGYLNEYSFWDYDDLILNVIELLKNSEIKKQLHETFPNIYVDEYQDIDLVQRCWLLNFVGEKSHVTAIGDPNQSIYGFRGSDVSLFQEFEKDFSLVTKIYLDENYRSSSHLLKASNQMISKTDPSAKELVAHFTSEKTLLDIYEARSDRAEAEYVVRRIEELIGGTSLFSEDSKRVQAAQRQDYSFGDFAILYRMNHQQHALRQALDRSGMPYEISGERPLLERKVIVDLIFHLKKSCGIQSEFLMEGLDQISKNDFQVQLLELFESGFLNQKSVADQKSLQQFQNFLNEAESLQDFLEMLSLQKPEDTGDYKIDRIKLMTLHASKGLEFPIVFIVGCEEGVIPMIRDDFETNLDEERRLFYVGMTRAKNQVILTYARKRRLFGELTFPEPSSFLNDIQSELKDLEKQKVKSRKDPRSQENQMTLF